MENKQRASTGGRRPIRLALGVVGVIVLAAGAYAGLRGPLGGVQITSSARAETAPAPNASMRTVTIPVEGMSCGSCAARIKKTLKAVDGVASAEVSLERREVLVRYAPGKVAPERIVSEINELGYKATLPKKEEPKAARAGAATSDSRVKTTTIPVLGMACESCAETVTGLLREMPGVEEARVNLKGKEARVKYVEGKVTPECLAEEISAQGFQAGSPSTEGQK